MSSGFSIFFLNTSFCGHCNKKSRRDKTIRKLGIESATDLWGNFNFAGQNRFWVLATREALRCTSALQDSEKNRFGRWTFSLIQVLYLSEAKTRTQISQKWKQTLTRHFLIQRQIYYTLFWCFLATIDGTCSRHEIRLLFDFNRAHPERMHSPHGLSAARAERKQAGGKRHTWRRLKLKVTFGRAVVMTCIFTDDQKHSTQTFFASKACAEAMSWKLELTEKPVKINSLRHQDYLTVLMPQHNDNDRSQYQNFEEHFQNLNFPVGRI